MTIKPLTIGCLMAMAAFSTVALAQRSGLSATDIIAIPGFQDSAVGVLLREDVADDLNLDHTQRREIQDAVFDIYAQGPQPYAPQGGYRRGRGRDRAPRANVPVTTYMDLLNKASDATGHYLSDSQQHRMDEIYLQFEGSLMLATDDKLARGLGLDGDQMRRIHQIYDDMTDDNYNAVRGTYDWRSRGVSDTIEHNRDKARRDIDHILTDQQFHRLDDSKGRPIRFDSAPRFFLSGRY